MLSLEQFTLLHFRRHSSPHPSVYERGWAPLFTRNTPCDRLASIYSSSSATFGSRSGWKWMVDIAWNCSWNSFISSIKDRPVGFGVAFYYSTASDWSANTEAISDRVGQEWRALLSYRTERCGLLVVLATCLGSHAEVNIRPAGGVACWGDSVSPNSRGGKATIEGSQRI